MTFIRKAAGAAAAVALVGAPLLARDYHHGSLSIITPWSRATSSRASTGAGFVIFHNAGARPDRLVSATTPIAAEVQIHSMKTTNGIMQMRLMPNGLGIPARGQAALEPSGSHIMFIGLKRPLKQGETFPVKLRLARAGIIAVRFQVENPGAQAPSPSHQEARR